MVTVEGERKCRGPNHLLRSVVPVLITVDVVSNMGLLEGLARRRKEKWDMQMAGWDPKDKSDRKTWRGLSESEKTAEMAEEEARRDQHNIEVLHSIGITHFPEYYYKLPDKQPTFSMGGKYIINRAIVGMKRGVAIADCTTAKVGIVHALYRDLSGNVYLADAQRVSTLRSDEELVPARLAAEDFYNWRLETVIDAHLISQDGRVVSKAEEKEALALAQKKLDDAKEKITSAPRKMSEHDSYSSWLERSQRRERQRQTRGPFDGVKGGHN